VSEPIIEIKQVAHAYKQGRQVVPALQEVSLSVSVGEIFGLLGPNGAGKTTLLSCIEGLLLPKEGDVCVDGHNVRQQSNRIKQVLGIQLQRTALMEELTASELIQTYAALYNVFLSTAQVAQLLDRFDLREQAARLTRRMSGGQQQRLALALAIANDPKIVVLDEPTESLDPHARRAIWDMIRTLRDEGRTVLFTTHQMDEAESLCDRVAIIDQGRLVACGRPAQLVADLHLSPILKASVDLPLERVRTLPGVSSARYSGAQLEMETTDAPTAMAALYTLAGALGRTLGEVTLRQPSLEDVYLRLTGKPLSA